MRNMGATLQWRSMPETFDALLVLSFGGPEKHDEVIPFLENVLRGRNVPRERMLEVAEHYYHFGGRSPINDQNRELVQAVRQELESHGLAIPVYWGNRNWHPFLADTLRQMKTAGVRRAAAFVTSAFSSYSGCRQYLEDIEAARAELGGEAPEVVKLRGFFNHPGFIDTMAARTCDALSAVPEERRAAAEIVFTAHSVPVAMAASSPYVGQLEEACRLLGEALGRDDWRLAYQSRSGPPSQPWLEPDILDLLRQDAARGVRDVVVIPIGFISDHMEVLYDLDTEAAALAGELGINLVRAATAGSHPRFVQMIRELVEERLSKRDRMSVGSLPSAPDICPADCCPAPQRLRRPA